MPRSKGKRKKTKTHVDAPEKYVPKSFILRRGRVDPSLKILHRDLRTLMYPNTAAELQERKNKSLRDFTSVAGMFGVTHLMVLTSTERANYIHFAKSPKFLNIRSQGKQDLMYLREVITTQKRSISLGKQFYQQPLLVLNGFQANKEGTDSHRKILSTMFQSMFPEIDLYSLKLDSCRRVALFAMLDGSEDLVEFRHYKIETRIRGVNKKIRKFINNGKLKNISKCEDISELVLGKKEGGYATSDSEAQDLPGSHTTLPANFGGKNKNSEVAVKLYEVGPRITMKLIKIQEGLFRGNVVLHRLISKSKGELEENRKRLLLKREEKLKRKKEQEENVKRKETLKKVRFAEDEE